MGSLVWVWFFVPETNGRTLEEMDQVINDNTGEDEQNQRARIESDIASQVYLHHPVV